MEIVDGVSVENLLLLARHTEVVHHIPGRIRVRVLPSALKALRETDIRSSLDSVPGVISLRVNAVVGSVVIEYDRSRLSFDFWENLRLLKKKPELAAEIKERLKSILG